MSPAFASLLSRLAVGVTLMLVALGGAGLAVAADPVHSDDRRPELTYRRDRQFELWWARMAEQLEATNAVLAELSLAGRDVLRQLYTQDSDGLDETLARGFARSGDAQDAREAILGLRLELGQQLAVERLSQANRDRLQAVDDASDALLEVPGAWSGLASAARTVADLVAALAEHDRLVFDATAAGRAGDWAQALRLLDEARTPLAAAREVRDRLVQVADVSILDELLRRYEAYDQALGSLYGALNGGAAPDSPDVAALESAVATAQQALPEDNAALTVIVADATGPSVADALTVIEAARGRVSETLGEQE